MTSKVRTFLVEEGDGKLGRATKRPAQLVESTVHWRCAWPRNSVADRLREQKVYIRAIVGRDGSPSRVDIVNDPTNGFGAAAVACAMRQRYLPARDKDGAPVDGPTNPFAVVFVR